jgi:hypothetical protein
MRLGALSHRIACQAFLDWTRFAKRDRAWAGAKLCWTIKRSCRGCQTGSPEGEGTFSSCSLN